MHSLRDVQKDILRNAEEMSAKERAEEAVHVAQCGNILQSSQAFSKEIYQRDAVMESP